MDFLRLLPRFIFFSSIFLLASFVTTLLLPRGTETRYPLKTPSATRPHLRVTDAQTFSIAIFSDLHFGEDESTFGPAQDSKSLLVMDSILKDEGLDLIVLLGDLITGENTFRENATEYVDMLLTPIIQFARPWASVYGNHDSQFNLSREALFRAETSYSFSQTRCMTPGTNSGITNYYVFIRGMADEPIAVLWFFDSRGGNKFGESGEGARIPGVVPQETIDWFEKAKKDIRDEYGRDFPSLAFVHIPPRVFLAAQKEGIDKRRFPGNNADVPLSAQDTEDPSRYNDNGEEYDVESEPFAKALMQTEGLHSIHTAHDHGNSWCAEWPGDAARRANALSNPQNGRWRRRPFLCFSRRTGYGGYGDFDRGARILRLGFPDGGMLGRMEVDTWSRMEGGDVRGRVRLNGTYGMDLYDGEVEG